MDYQVVWSPEALDDVDEIASYIAKDSPFYAQSVVEQIRESSQALKHFPARGRKVPELNDERYRECFIYSYRMIYCLEGQDVSIIAVIHGARLLSAVEERLEA